MDLPVSPLAPKQLIELPSIDGVETATMSLGLYGARDDLMIVRFPDGAATGGVFTRSLTRSADVDWCRDALAASGGMAKVLVVNAGNSNAFTGAAGIAKNHATIDATASLASCPREQVYLAATGVIGEPMAADMVAKGVQHCWEDVSPGGLNAASQAFMTTDTFPKRAMASGAIADQSYTIAGIAKGSGMIAPNMATMLAYVFTDANVSPAVCQALVSRFTERTFNCVTVDSDTSTSDSLMLFATGKAGGPCIEDPDASELAAFRADLLNVMEDLAVQLVRDGEGASKLVSIKVTGAKSDTSAKTIAAAVANSPLVKTALAASDANWGRVVMAVGKAGEPIERDQLAISFGDVEVARNGMRAPDYSEDAASRVCAEQEIDISIDVGVGEGAAKVWTCDLTHGYVEINGAYRT